MFKTEYNQFGVKDIDILSVEDRFSGFFKIQEYTFKHRLFEGGYSGTVKREMLERGDAVAVIPYDPSCDSVVMIEQIRIGALNHAHSPWLFEFIAGMIEQGESALDVGIREAQEEAGVNIEQLHPMLSYYSSPGGTTERIHLYVAKATVEGVSGIHGLDHEHEDIRVHVFSLDEALMMLAQGKIDNAATIIGLQWLALNRAKLANLWS